MYLHLMVRRRIIYFMALACLSATGCGSALTYVKVADLTSAVPNQGEQFAWFNFYDDNGLPCYDGENVAFVGGPAIDSGVYGVYQWNEDDGLSRIVDNQSPTNGFFGTYELDGNGVDAQLALDDGVVAVRVPASATAPGQTATAGILTNVTPPVSCVLDDSGRFMSSQNEAITDLRFQSYSNGKIAFEGASSDIWVFIWPGNFQLVNKQTGLPGAPGTFINAFRPYIDGNRVAFFARGTGAILGLYLADVTFPGNPVIARVVDTTTQVPTAGHGNFIDFDYHAVVDGTDVLFVGVAADGYRGMFLSSGGNIRKIVDVDDFLPGRTTTFTGFSTAQASLDNGDVLFAGTDDTVAGLFSKLGTSKLSKVVVTGDLINSQAVGIVSIGPYALQDRKFACWMVTAPGIGTQNTGIFLGDLENPAARLAKDAWNQLNPFASADSE